MQSHAGSTKTDWIESLEVESGLTDVHLEGGPRPTLASRVAASLDRLIVTEASLPYVLNVRSTLGAMPFERYMAEHAFYTDPRFLEDPRSFYQEPPDDVVVTETHEAHRFERLGVDCRHIVFESPFRTLNPALRHEYAGLSPNERVEARGFFHRDRPRTIAIVLHGYFASAFGLNERFFLVDRMIRAGLDVVLVQLPFHGLRQPPGSLFDGQAIMTPRYFRVLEAVGQGVLDLRILVRHLRKTRNVPVGVTGYSWGGTHSALLAAIEPDLAFSMPVGHVASMVDVLQAWPVRHYLRYRFDDPATILRGLRRIVAPTSPLSFEPAIDPGRILLVCGLGDRIAPPGHTQHLHERWPGSRVHWSQGAHIAYYDRAAVLRTQLAFLGGMGLLGANPTA